MKKRQWHKVLNQQIKRSAWILLSLLTVACTSGQSHVTTEEATAVAEQGAPLVTEQPYTLFVAAKQLAKGKFEPDKGCYLGAYILSNKNTNDTISNFEERTEKSHAFYMYNLKLGDPFPESWILDCVSRQKTPNVVIAPPNTYQPYDVTLLIETAQQFAKYNVPLFIHFYPNPTTEKFDPVEYKAFFQLAKNIFDQYVPGNVFVFSVKYDTAPDYEQFYPGDASVDWVGLNLYERVQQTENPVYGADVISNIDYFYYTFQKQKPLMISQLGISYYQRQWNRYVTNDAKVELAQIYSLIQKEYPRIKAVIYVDYNGIGNNTEAVVPDNFAITENDVMSEQYTKSVEDPYFLSKLENKNDNTAVQIKSPFPVYQVDHIFYVSEDSLRYDLDAPTLMEGARRVIQGKNYRILDRSRLPVEMNEEQKKVVIY